MSAIPTRRGDPDEVPALLRVLIEEVRGLRRDLRKRDAAPDASALLVAVETVYGRTGRFTAGTLIARSETCPELADALAEVIDLNAEPRASATALGKLLNTLPDIQCVARRDNAAVYRLRGLRRGSPLRPGCGPS